jgi:8-amino-7-oxononanoate synthase
MPSNFQIGFQRELQTGLGGLEAQGRRRSLGEICGVNFCSNDYLGLAEHPALKKAVVEAVLTAARMGGTGSRLLSGQASAWHELEEEFARFAGTEAALYFASGYTANLGLLTSLLKKDDLVFSDALNHASLIDGMRLSGARKIVYPHLDLNFLETALRNRAAERCRKLLVTESVFSMNGDVAPVTELLALADRFDAGVILDEAHATGVHGPSGRGIAAEHGNVQNLAATVHTCGKALASAGAFVCGSAVLKEHLINHARTFIFSTAMPPYMAEQIRAALRLTSGMDKERKELLARAKRFAAGLRAQGWDTGNSAAQIVPVIMGENEAALAAAEFLQREGFAVRAIRPPTVPPGSARLRFSLTCGISEKEITDLKDGMRIWSKQVCHSVAAGNA